MIKKQNDSDFLKNDSNFCPALVIRIAAFNEVKHLRQTIITRIFEQERN